MKPRKAAGFAFLSIINALTSPSTHTLSKLSFGTRHNFFFFFTKALEHNMAKNYNVCSVRSGLGSWGLLHD